MRWHAFFCGLGLLTVLSCTDSTLLHRYKALPTEGWDRSDSVSFFLPETVIRSGKTLTIGLRTKAQTSLRSVVLAVDWCSATSGITFTDTIFYPLSDAEGYALMPGVNHHQYETQRLPLRLSRDGEGTVSIRHLMRNDVVVGITEVGVRVDR